MKKQPEHNRKNVPPQDTAKAPKSAVSRSMRTRAIVLAALFVLVGFGAVVYNLYQLQIVQHDELAARAENQQLADETITPFSRARRRIRRYAPRCILPGCRPPA